MKNALWASLTAWRRYRAEMSGSKTSKALRWIVACGALAYILLLTFPQVLFAYEVSHGNITVYSRQPIDQNVHAILDRVEAKLAASGVNDPGLAPRVFIVDSHRLYAFLGLYVGANSFAKGYSALPATNIFVNRSDLARDVVFRDAAVNNERRLSDVITHEVTHFLVRKKVGYLKNLTLPAWKHEGFSEYVAGGTLLDRETAVRMWRQNSTDDTGYRYFKYYMLVKYLIDVKKLSVEDLLTRPFDVRALEREVLDSLNGPHTMYRSGVRQDGGVPSQSIWFDGQTQVRSETSRAPLRANLSSRKARQMLSAPGQD